RRRFALVSYLGDPRVLQTLVLVHILDLDGGFGHSIDTVSPHDEVAFAHIIMIRLVIYRCHELTRLRRNSNRIELEQRQRAKRQRWLHLWLNNWQRWLLHKRR